MSFVVIDEQMGAKLRAETMRVLTATDTPLEETTLSALYQLLSKCDDIIKAGYAIGYREGERQSSQRLSER